MLFDGGEDAESWKAASVRFRGAVTEHGGIIALERTCKLLGKLVTRKLARMQESSALPGAQDGRYVVMTMQAAFEHKRSVTETVTVMFGHDGVLPDTSSNERLEYRSRE